VIRLVLELRRSRRATSFVYDGKVGVQTAALTIEDWGIIEGEAMEFPGFTGHPGAASCGLLRTAQG
jgi:hypothetical protein